MKLFDWLWLTEARAIHDLDSPAATLLHRRIIQKKPFLNRLYRDFYAHLIQTLLPLEHKILIELGSGGGFLKDLLPQVVASDILCLPHIDLCCSALNLPFKNTALDGILMIDVFHHLTNAPMFLKEVCRCLKVGGKLVMIEPACTLWSNFIWNNFHHEPCDPSGDWQLPWQGPYSSGNIALPFIVFQRDRSRFEREFPGLKVLSVQPHTPFRYLVSGGVSIRQLLPDFAYNLVNLLEWVLTPFRHYFGMFLMIELEKTS